MEARPPGRVGLYSLFSCLVHPWLFAEMPEINIFLPEMSLLWHFRAVYQLCASMRKQFKKLLWVHTVNNAVENANRMENPLYFAKKLKET